MTTALVVAGLVVLFAVYRLGGSAVCLQCGGRGSHRDGCPWRR